MRKMILLATSWLLLSACVTLPSGNAALVNCDRQSWRPCGFGTPQNPEVNINTESRKLKARPYCINAKKGSQIVFKLTPPGNAALGEVELIGKNSDSSWINAKNDMDQDEIRVDVPPELDTTKRYLYGIRFGSKCTDPRVNVKN